ncbi:MAG: MFS transporter [Patescibacteria group bacterium]|nr:MFS transporter [Patescibacteria group bacterium]
MRKRHVAAITLLTALNVLNYFDTTVVSAFGPSLKRDFSIGDAGLGLIGSAFLFSLVLSSPFFGILLARISRVKLLASSVVIWSIALGSMGYLKLFALVLVSRMLAGIAHSAFTAVAPTLLDEIVTQRIKSKVFSIYYAAIPVGTAACFIYAGFMDVRIGWPAALLLAGLSGVVLAPLVLWLPRGTENTARGVLGTSIIQHIKILASSKRFILTILGYAAQTFALGGFAFWAPTYINNVLGYPLALGNAIFGSTLILTGIAGTLIGGVIADHWGGKDRVGSYLKACVLFTALAIPFAFLSLATQSDYVFFFSMGLVELMIFATFSPTNLIFLRSVPYAVRATALGVSIFVGRLLGDASSVWMVGFISDYIDSLKSALFILPLAFVVNLLFWWLAARSPREYVNP